MTEDYNGVKTLKNLQTIPQQHIVPEWLANACTCKREYLVVDRIVLLFVAGVFIFQILLH